MPQARVDCHALHVLALSGAHGVTSPRSGGRVFHFCLFWFNVCTSLDGHFVGTSAVTRACNTAV
jgi:hypothetical protein